MMSKDRPLEDLRSLGEFLRQQVPPAISAGVAASAVGQRRPRRSRTWVGVLATAALLALSNVALAQVADSAVPGELLYPVDRALEWLADRFGPEDRVPERVQEALELADSGNTDRALHVVEEILPGSNGLQTQVSELAGSGNSAAVREKVKDLVGAAFLVHDAAQLGDREELRAAIANARQEAQEVAETASKGNAGGKGNDAGTANPSVTAPGLIENPSVTAPGGGQGRSKP